MSNDFWGDLRKHGDIHATRQVVASYRRHGKTFLLMTRSSDFAKAFARELALQPQEWKAVSRGEHLSGVNLGNSIILAVADFSQTDLWLKAFDFSGLMIAIGEGAALLYPNGNPVELNNNPHHPSFAQGAIEQSAIEQSITQSLTLTGNATWDDPTTDPIEDIYNALEALGSNPPIGASLEIENGLLAYRVGGRAC